ncbi:unnamed protein product [Euphydryas editha]|uniref:Uncharacterized protein n=1 Tax=Euphydryas editha TaxID=104508 RepID=A0AAU9UDN7_EUPED|nr:unnamed protein product [Euphydryas editha]
MDLTKLRLPGEYLADVFEKENYEPTPSTSMEPPLKKARHDDFIENLVSENNKLKYKVKLLSQRLKRRDIKINNLKSALNIIKKKSTNFEEVERVLVNNFSHIHEHVFITRINLINPCGTKMK